VFGLLCFFLLNRDSLNTRVQTTQEDDLPKYDRRCGACGNVFEVTCKISDKGNNFYCPECGNADGDWMPSAPALAEPQRLMTAKKDTGFKEVLSKIAERNPRTNVTQQV